jgi:uncharacterized protein YggU (UPF0235/DUF167 family)
MATVERSEARSRGSHKDHLRPTDLRMERTERIVEREVIVKEVAERGNRNFDFFGALANQFQPRQQLVVVIFGEAWSHRSVTPRATVEVGHAALLSLVVRTLSYWERNSLIFSLPCSFSSPASKRSA